VAKADPSQVKWLPDAGEDDYAAANAYLALIKPPDNVAKLVAKLKTAKVEEYKATDLFRASRVALPAEDDRPCRKAIKKIRDGEVIAPVLLVRDAAHSTVIIADGYHRVCAAFRIDPDVVLHCKIA
jgi:hypothetical protein